MSDVFLVSYRMRKHRAKAIGKEETDSLAVQHFGKGKRHFQSNFHWFCLNCISPAVKKMCFLVYDRTSWKKQ